jgi:hypothetical protein
MEAPRVRHLVEELHKAIAEERAAHENVERKLAQLREHCRRDEIAAKNGGRNAAVAGR